MPIAFVQQQVIQSTSSVASLTTSAITVAAGNALAVCSSENYPATIIVTDSKGDSFNTASTNIESGIQGAQVDIATGAVGGSTTVTITPQFTAFLGICVQEYSGVADAPIESASSAWESSSSVVLPPAVDPPSLGDLYLSAWTHNGAVNQTFTPNSGWTLRSNLTNTANMPLGSAELIGSGPQIGSATLSAAATWSVAVMALRAADVAAPDDSVSPNFVASDFPMTDRGFIE